MLKYLDEGVNKVMQKITANEAQHILKDGQKRCALKISGCFYYSEGGRSYRFEQHHNQKALEAFLQYEELAITKQELQQTIHQLIVRQISYDWFTDISTDVLVEQLTLLTELDVFFF